MTEREMLDLLASRYTSIRQGTIADRWVRAEHVPSALGYEQKRIADFIAADKYPGNPYGSGLAFHGHEVKVSRSDWLTELRDPTKAEAFKPYMHHWWLVVPDSSIVKPTELPEGWGLLVKSGNVLRAKVKAPRLSPEALPMDLAISMMASAARTAHRDPLRRDSPIAYVKSWTPRCGFCGDIAPCPIHQPRQTARELAST
ncbi:hypothetical protein I3U41_17385 [Mycobacteroides abscessus subsp. abscessus]|uniref:hypothetical protein n=1 Tax=Mycobacteroides abscessus TaxID=36809 RepID=UPI0019D2E8B1|nr:hypothetical protein [Mycobacteroides abscessus]QSN19679.1 hypothetical protein I3U41_17385 [Mycobacteroides abscessus subsp. abscessus]